MALTPEQVEHIARLARIGLTEQEIRSLTGQLSRILEHMDSLRQLDTRDLPSTYHVLPLTNVLRSDEARPSLPREAALANAPQAEEGAFRVPKITEG